MADFRCERLFVILDEPVPKLDHLKAVDAVGFASIDSDAVAEQAGLMPLSAFTFAPFERPRWRAAAKGLKTVRGLMALYREWLAQGHNAYGYTEEAVKRSLVVFGQVESVLDAADSRDRKFYFAAKGPV